MTFFPDSFSVQKAYQHISHTSQLCMHTYQLPIQINHCSSRSHIIQTSFALFPLDCICPSLEQLPIILHTYTWEILMMKVQNYSYCSAIIVSMYTHKSINVHGYKYMGMIWSICSENIIKMDI